MIWTLAVLAWAVSLWWAYASGVYDGVAWSEAHTERRWRHACETVRLRIEHADKGYGTAASREELP